MPSTTTTTTTTPTPTTCFRTAAAQRIISAIAMPELPAHASPSLAARSSLDERDATVAAAASSNNTSISTSDLNTAALALSLDDNDNDNDNAATTIGATTAHEHDHDHDHDRAPPANLISPAFTPPPTPGTGTPAAHRAAAPIPIDLDLATKLPRPRLLDVLPDVTCLVRARIPTTTGQDMFLHLYTNSLDAKEHLAIVFGPNIRSRSLDAPRPGETERDRMIRGAYTGRLYPGRVSSRPEAAASSAASVPGAQAAAKPGAVEAAKASALKTSAASTARAEAAASTATGATPALPLPSPIPLVRIHSECYTGETVWSARCDCGEQLDEAGRLMGLPGCTDGVIVYLRQEGRGIGLGEKLKAYNLQDLGNDTVEANLLLRHPADARSYGLATAMLLDLGLGGPRGIRLLTNNPDKVSAVEGPNREVVVRERVAMIPLSWGRGKGKGKEGGEVAVGAERDAYLRTKIERMGHMLQM